MLRYHTQLRADLRERYGVDLIEWFDRPAKTRDLLALIEGLGEPSRYSAAVARDPEVLAEVIGSEARGESAWAPSLEDWTLTNQYLATVVDLLSAQLSQAAGKTTPPKPTPRPVTAIEQAKQISAEHAIDDVFGALGMTI